MRLIQVFALLLITNLTLAFPCQKYKFDFDEKCVSGNLLISWSFNSGFRSCGDFSKVDIRKKQFIIRIIDLFDNELVRDTVTGNTYNLVLTKEEPRIFYLREIESLNGETNIFLGHRNFPNSVSLIDSINHFLLGGFFYNAKYLLDKKELLNQDTIKFLYQNLFPEFYPDPIDFFNHYFDPVTKKLIRIPYVSLSAEFLRIVNDQTKSKKEKLKISVWARVSGNDQLIDYEVAPKEYTSVIEPAISKLQFDNKNETTSYLLLMLTPKRGKYVLYNERALMNPASPGYKKKFQYMGAIH